MEEEKNKNISNEDANKKEEKRASGVVKFFIFLVIAVVCVGAYFGITKWYEDKFQNKNVEVKEEAEEITNEPLYTFEEFPKVDASLATQPLVEAFMSNFTGKNDIDFKNYDFSNTHPGYVKLVNDEVDLIVVTQPSEEELQLAKEKGVELEVIPVVKEGFVFYVNAENIVDNLTVSQIQDIYSGKITNWKDVGGENVDIKAYQRPVNSGSQTGMLALVMKDIPLMKAPKENLVETMAAIVNLVSSYDNGKNSIGYSYYYYATTMYDTIDKDVASRIKFLGINGVKPNEKTIKDGSYPFTTAYYIVINKADDENSASRKLANYMLSARGQKVAKEAGYVPVK